MTPARTVSPPSPSPSPLSASASAPEHKALAPAALAPEALAHALATESAAPQVVALVGFVVAVVSVPVGTYAPFALHAALLMAVAAWFRLNLGRLARGLGVEVPFVAFALFLPLVATGPRFAVGGMQLSIAGTAAAASILCKATLATLAALMLGQLTTPAAVLAGLRTLRVPAALTEIAAFMLRYLVVLTDEWRRMSIARRARGAAATGPRAWIALARGVGVLFVRAFERGERVHLARLARGYSVGAEVTRTRPARGRAWAAAVVIVALAAGSSALPLLVAWGRA